MIAKFRFQATSGRTLDGNAREQPPLPAEFEDVEIPRLFWSPSKNVASLREATFHL
jgi:hypothetical protein